MVDGDGRVEGHPGRSRSRAEPYVAVGEMSDLTTGSLLAVFNQLRIMWEGSATLDSLLRAIREKEVNLVVFSDRLEPDMPRLELVDRVVRTVLEYRGRECAMIVLSDTDRGTTVEQVLELGVLGYLYIGDTISECLPKAIKFVRNEVPYLSDRASSQYAIVQQAGRERPDVESQRILELMGQGYGPGE